MIGRTVGHYLVLSRLGGGGMGVVYKGEDLSLGRFVALKFLPPEMTRDEEARKRFLREARAASQLDHPNICTVHEIGESDGQIWIAMGYYDGETLASRVDRGPCGVEEAVGFAIQVARGLAKAHASGIVHRDIKPANVVVTRDGVAKIVDFGLAKLSGATNITASQQMLGTLAYMAPEQISGGEVGRQADLWALGMVLFELLTGRKPFRGDYAQAVAYAILNDQPAALAELRPDAPPELDRIVKKLLRKDPLQRYQSAEEVIAELAPLTSKGRGGTARVAGATPALEPLRPGAKLGPYEILASLGSGASGDVYRARDTRLDRQVAVRVLAPGLSEDAEWSRRFQGEAKAISSLAHPNVCTLFDVGEQEGVRYLVMEYVEGETLAERLAQAPLRRDEMLKIGAEIAEALGRAHLQGLVHRGLKPSNVVITPTGVVKLLDFGVSKGVASVLEPSSPRSDVRRNGGRPDSDDPTKRRDPLPEALAPPPVDESVASTLPYLSPEQVEGRSPDPRSDVFALGAILYEMATGRRAFEGATKASVVAALLKEEPAMPAGSPNGSGASRIVAQDPLSPIMRVVSRCLEKNPDRRWQSGLDVANELRRAAAEVAMAPGARGDDGNARRRRWKLLAGVLALTTIASIVWALVVARRAVEQASIAAPPGPESVPKLAHLTTERGDERGPTISPDGTSFAYSGAPPHALRNADIFVRRVGGANAINLTKDYAGGDFAPEFSPDGSSISFYSARDGGGIFVMGATGESVRRVTDFGYSPSWSPDGRSLVFAASSETLSYNSATRELWVVDVASGASRKILEGWYLHGIWYLVGRPTSWSPSGGRIAFAGSREADPESHRLWTIPADGGEPVEVATGGLAGSPSAWTREGLWFVRRGSGELWTVPVDEETGSASGPPRLRMQSTGLSDHPSVTKDGRRVVFANGTGGSTILQWEFDAASERIAPHPRTIASMTTEIMLLEEPSPDGAWIVSARVEPQWDILLIDTATGERRVLTNDVLREEGFDWAPDGSRLYYSIAPNGRRELWSIRVDGGHPRRELPPLPQGEIQGWGLSPDGRLLFVETGGGGPSGMVSLADEPSKRTLVPIPSFPDGSTFRLYDWSSDGRYLAGYLRDRAGVTGSSLHLYDVERRTYRKLADLPRRRNCSWLPDSRRMLLADWNSGAVEIIDTKNGRIRSLGSVGDGVFNLRLSADRKTLVGFTREQEWDIWMLEYGDARHVPTSAARNE